MRRIGMLMNATADESESQLRLAAFREGLQKAGWIVGRNVQFETRWSNAETAVLRQSAKASFRRSSQTSCSGRNGRHHFPAPAPARRGGDTRQVDRRRESRRTRPRSLAT